MRVIFDGQIHPWEWCWRVSSDSRKDHFYVVTICLDDGLTTCQCEDWVYRRQKHDCLHSCKHVSRVVKLAELIQKRKREENE